MIKLLSFLYAVMFVMIIACNAAPANKLNIANYNPYYTRNYFRNRDYYNNRRYYNNFFKHYNPNVSDQEARIIEQNAIPIQNGVYSYLYETENGIHGEERGFPVNNAQHEQTEHVEGSFSFITADGLRVGVRYTANENGYHPIISYDGPYAEQYANQPQPADVVLTRIN